MVSMRSGKSIWAPPRLSGVSPMLPLMARSRPLKEDRWGLPLSTPLSPPGDGSMVWCTWLCTRRQCLKLLNTSDLPRRHPIVVVALPANLSALSFPSECIDSSNWSLKAARVCYGKQFHAVFVDSTCFEARVTLCSRELNLSCDQSELFWANYYSCVSRLAGQHTCSKLHAIHC